MQPVRHDQRARFGVKVFRPFEYAHPLPRSAKQVRSEQARNRSSNNPDFAVQRLIFLGSNSFSQAVRQIATRPHHYGTLLRSEARRTKVMVVTLFYRKIRIKGNQILSVRLTTPGHRKIRFSNFVNGDVAPPSELQYSHRLPRTIGARSMPIVRSTQAGVSRTFNHSLTAGDTEFLPKTAKCSVLGFACRQPKCAEMILALLRM